MGLWHVSGSPDGSRGRMAAQLNRHKEIEMPRRREVPKREILPDPKFGSVELAKFMNVVMLSFSKL